MSSAPSELKNQLKNIVVRAGAGAGKTTELTQRVLSLAESFKKTHERFPRLMVTTFTRKATQELKERLLKKAMEMEQPELIRFVKSPGRLHISTIHGILSLFLSKYGTVIGLSPRFAILSHKKNQILIKKKIRELCEKNFEFNLSFQTLLESVEFSDLLDGLYQFSVHSHEFENMRPATADDFTRIMQKKSDEMKVLLKQYAQDIRSAGLPEAWQQLASHLEASLQQKNPNWLKVDDEMPATRKTKEMSEEWSARKKEISKKLQDLSDWSCQPSYWQEHQVLAKDFAYCAVLLSEQVYLEKIRRAELTMQDLEMVSLRLMRQNPDIAKAFAETCDYWFIDEYQDTSPVQVELLRALSQGSSSFIVGDPQQSIYLFRGARSEVFNEQEKRVKEQGGELLEKRINYRSQPELLEFFNHFFTGLSSQFSPMQPKSETCPTGAEPIAEILIATENEEEKTRDAELEAVIFRCQELIKAGAHPEEVCVLSRDNKDLDQLALLAKKYNLPVQRHSSGKFFERREIMDALSLLKFLCNPHDNKNFVQLLRTPAFFVSDQRIYETAQGAQKSYWQTFKNLEEENIQTLSVALQQARLQGLGMTWRSLLIDKGFFKAAHAMDSSGQREANLWKLVHLIISKERSPGFSHLEFLNSLDLASLSTEEQDQGDGVPVVEPSKVHLMTVHASKGLQFDHIVFSRLGDEGQAARARFYMLDEQSQIWTLTVVDPEEGKKVSSLAGDEILRQENERAYLESDRLLYVAMTRAKCSVSLIMGEKHRSRSWAARWPLEMAEGMHKLEKFSYRVRRERFEPEVQKADLDSSSLLLSAFDFKEFSQRQSTSVTAILESSLKADAKASSRAHTEKDVEAINKAISGTEMHRLFESLQYFGLKDSKFDWKQLLPDLTATQKKALEFLTQDKNGFWLDLIRRGEVEEGIAVLKAPHLIQGQIDLWGRDVQGRPWIVDYKTGSERYKDKAFEQLDIYAWALRKMKKIKEDETVHLAVIYPLSESSYERDAKSFHDADIWVASLVPGP